MALLTCHLLMFICKKVFCLGVVDLYLLPSIGSMAVNACRLSLMRIFVACYALFVLLNLELVFRMTLRTLDVNMFSLKLILRVSVMLELLYILPAFEVVATSAVLIQLSLMLVFMA